jgi:hypothetical protein
MTLAGQVLNFRFHCRRQAITLSHRRQSRHTRPPTRPSLTTPCDVLGNNFVVQYSTNLTGTNWMNLVSLTNLPASRYPFLDPAGESEPARFYQAFMQ